MESFEENNGDKDKLLEPPSPLDLCTEEDDVKATIKPRLSPLPRRRTSSISSDDGELEPPTSVTRKVSFADAFGFDLVSVKEFNTWDVPIVSPTFETESVQIEEFYLTSSFILPPIGYIVERLHTKKVLLESVDFIPSTAAMKGIIRVLNLSYEKQVFVRMSFDDWQSFYDLQAEYIPDSFNANTDQFGFTLSFASPYQKEGSKVEFCICYETSVGTFWDNNDGSNYVLTCQKKEEYVEVFKPLEDVADKNKKSCLKTAASKEDEDIDVCEAEQPTIAEKPIPRIICSHDEYTEGNQDEEKENTREEKNNEDESDLEVFLSQRLMKARITSSEEQQNIESSDRFNSQTEKEQDNETKYYTCDDSKPQDHFSQESQVYDNKEEHPSLYEPTSSLAAEYFLATPNNIHNFTEALSQEYSHETEEPAFYPDELQKDTTSDSWLETLESPTFTQGENIDVTETLDHNANPSCSDNHIHMKYFPTDNTEEMQYEYSENLKTETETQEDNILTENDMTEGLGRQHPVICSQLDDYQVLSYQYKPSCSVDPETEHAEANQSALTLASSSDSYSFKESQVEEIGEGSQNKKVITGFHTDWKAPDDMSDLSNEKMDVPSEDTDLYGFQSVPVQISKQYVVTTQNLNSRHSDQEADKKHVMCDGNLILSDNDDIYDVTYPSYEDRGIDSDQTDRTVSEPTVTESLPESHPSIACSTAENVTLGTLHGWNEMLGTFPSEVTPGNKVVIAKITEEKGQSETCSQGRDDSKRSYIDMCESGGAAQLGDSSAKSKLKRGDIDHTSKPMPVPCDREGMDDIEGERLDTSSLRALSEEGFSHEDTEYTPKGKYDYESRLNDVLTESDIHHEEPNPVTQISESFELREDKDVTMWEDFDNKTNDRKVAEYVDLELKVIPEEDMEYELDSPEQSFIGPSILISEPDDEEESQCTDTEEQVKPEDTHQYYYPFADNETHSETEVLTDTETTEHLNISRASSKVLCFLMFVVFAGLMYHYDFLVCFALYLFSLYWLYWEGDRGKTLVRKD